MKRIHISRHSGILSAVGIALADLVVEKQLPATDQLTNDKMVNDRLTARLEQLRDEGFGELVGRVPHRVVEVLPYTIQYKFSLCCFIGKEGKHSILHVLESTV